MAGSLSVGQRLVTHHAMLSMTATGSPKESLSKTSRNALKSVVGVVSLWLQSKAIKTTEQSTIRSADINGMDLSTIWKRELLQTFTSTERKTSEA